MNELVKLISEFCPNGVVYLPLEQCCSILDNQRKPVTKAAREAGEYPYYGANGIQDYVSDYIFDGTFVLVGEDGSVVTPAGTPVITWATGKIWVNNHAHIIEEKDGVLLRFLFHYLQTVNVSPLIHGNIPKLTGGDFRAIRIPLPPLEVQQEIVRVLDSFTELTAELTAELAARRKQYEHYRDELLTFGDDVPEATLGDICDFKYGKGNNIPTEHGNYPVYGCNGVVATTNTFNSEDAPVIGHIGSAGIVNWGAGKHYVTYNGTICNVKSDKMISRYAYHLLCSLHLERFVKGSQPFLSYGDFSKETVSVPPIEKQQRIVTILDRFDTLCNDLTSGLPAEIAARQKQYEYYRDKLLTFKEL